MSSHSIYGTDAHSSRLEAISKPLRAFCVMRRSESVIKILNHLRCTRCSPVLFSLCPIIERRSAFLEFVTKRTALLTLGPQTNDRNRKRDRENASLLATPNYVNIGQNRTPKPAELCVLTRIVVVALIENKTDTSMDSKKARMTADPIKCHHQRKVNGHLKQQLRCLGTRVSMRTDHHRVNG